MSRSKEVFQNLINRIKLYDLQSYLTSSGWYKTPSNGKRWQLFEMTGDGSSGLRLMLPVADNYIDSKDRFIQAIEALAQIEERSIFDICMDLLTTNSDSMRFRLQIPESESSLLIENASRHVKSIKNLLLYSACSEIKSMPHFEHPIPAAQGMLSDFEFCHTFQGSFGFEISTKVVRENTVPDLFEPPANRKVVERIARGLISLEKAVEKEDPDILIKSYESAMNARMCDAISQIGLGGELSFGIDIDWASMAAPSEDVSNFKSQVISEAHVSMLAFASEKLKIIEPEPKSISGLVVNLHCVTNPTEGTARRTIAIKVDHIQYGLIEVRLALGPDAYQLALNAHSEGKQLIASGQLQRKGNTWSLDAITSVLVGN